MQSEHRSPRLYNLLSGGRLLKFSKAEELGSSSSMTGIYLVIEGLIKRYSISNKGTIGVQIIYRPEDFFSLTKVYRVLLNQSLYDGPEDFYYSAITNSRVYYLDAARFVESVKQDPSLYKELFLEAGHHLKSCIHTIENMSLDSSYKRVAHQLIFFAQDLGKPHNGGLIIKAPITQQDIADFLGLTRETVSLAINKLKYENLIKSQGGIFVPNVNKLIKVAYA